MLVEEINAVGPQATKRRFSDLFDALRAAIGTRASLSRLKVDVEAEFGRNDNLLADVLLRLADHLFFLEGSIRFSRVEEVDAMIVSAANQLDQLLAVGWRTRDRSDAHAARL